MTDVPRRSPPPPDPLGCPLDARTGYQLQPSGLATAIFLLCCLLVLLGPLDLALRGRPGPAAVPWGPREWALIVAALGLECLGLVVYHHHQRRCAAPLGFFCFVLTTVPAGMLWQAATTPAEK